MYSKGILSKAKIYIVLVSKFEKTTTLNKQQQETHTLFVFDRLPVVSWHRVKYKQMYGLKSTLTVSR